MAESRHLAIDLGAESGRAITGRLKDGKLVLDELYRFPTQGLFVNGSLRWDIYRFFEEIKRSLKKYSASYGPGLDSVGVDAWGVDFGLIDSKGDLVGIPYHYRDGRTIGTEKIINEKIGSDRLYDLTGTQMLPINTLNQLAAMKRDCDPSLEYGGKIQFIGDLLHYFLTGTSVAEFTAVSISQLYNPNKNDWDDEIFEAFGLHKNLKNRIIRAGDIIGNLREDICSDCGLKPGVKVVAPAVHDTASSAAAAPGEGENWGYISSGTWSLAGLELGAAVINDECFRMNISNSGGVFGKTLFLKNIMGLWIIQQCRRLWLNKGIEISYADIAQQASDAEAFTAYIEPDDSVFLNPESMPEAVIEYLGRTGQRKLDTDNIGMIARIVFESLAFKYRYVFDRLCEASGKKIKTLHIIGGGIQNRLLNRFTTDALGLKVITGPVEASATGNILMQAYGCGRINSHKELRTVVKNSFKMEEYMPSEHAHWDCSYHKFLEVTGLK